MLRTLVATRGFFWVLLVLPAIPMVLAVAGGMPDPEGRTVVEQLLHSTGETAARLMIAAMAITPLRTIFPRSGFLHWMVQRRRYLGVAAFGYAAAHTGLYVLDTGSLQAMLGEALAIGIWTGWMAGLIMLPLALTSNNLLQRRLGRAWKPLQRAAYAAAIATLAHWIFVHNNAPAALVHFAPLALLEIWRIRCHFGRNAAPSS